MRTLTDQERIRLASFVGSEEWNLATEIMEESLNALLETVKTMPPSATNEQAANALRGYQFAAAHYAEFIKLLEREVGAVGKAQPGIQPDITEGVLPPVN